ncbi:MAG: DNA translocase FtsK 4TM domain-containing protein [Gammaproteobacteria bacterium]|nr:DNA translocase FtsK 4TM domain-containing protein [Gammaproteobacteria bacterium]
MTKQQKKVVFSSPWAKRLCEGGFILVSALSIFVFLALMTYKISDPGWFHSSESGLIVLNAGGRVGAYIADFLYTIFGYAAYGLPVALAYLAWVIVYDHRTLGLISKPMLALRTTGIALLLLGGCGLLVFCVAGKTVVLHQPGGIFGQIVAITFHQVFNSEGTFLLLFAATLIGVTWLTGLSWVRLIQMTGRGVWRILQASMVGIRSAFRVSKIGLQAIFRGSMIGLRELSRVSMIVTRAMLRQSVVLMRATQRFAQEVFARLVAMRERRTTSSAAPAVEPRLSPTLVRPKPVSRKEQKLAVKTAHVDVTPPKAPMAPAFSATPMPDAATTGTLPALNLLAKVAAHQKPVVGYSHQALEALSHELEQHLLDFGIQANVVAAHPGPVITRFELQLAAGIKVNKLSTLAKDLARSLSVTSVRVVEIIPGKTVVGLELPNPERTTVVLSEVLSSEIYQQAHSPLTLALGVDIAGHPMVVDLAKMPHLLVAGTTGSGKSVGINAMILSLLFKSTPEQVRLILIDPKMLELSVYDGIPHLLTPVVTDMKEAASALRWCVEEMERRYRLMAALGVRNLAGFNTKLEEAAARGEALADPLWKPTDSMSEKAPELTTLPYVVVVIDELADMMMVVGKKVEQLIARIAQKARAAGIHLILATQRPSVDVLTGLIKSNIPTRISFQVSSKIDSRTILDQQGAEQLLGHGDMLFLAPGTGAPLRVHGAFVDDQEVHRVADDWRAKGTPHYIDEITEDMSNTNEYGGGDAVEDADPLYDEAVAFVMQTRKASTSSVQRRFKIGYNRAARLIDEMERVGMVGPLEGGARDVLVASRAEE